MWIVTGSPLRLGASALSLTAVDSVSTNNFCSNDLKLVKLVFASGVWGNPRVKLVPTDMYH